METVSQTTEPTIDVGELVEQWRERAANAIAYDQHQQGDILLELASELEEFVRRVLADSVAASQDEEDRRNVARARVDESAGRLAVPYPEEQRERAASLLAEWWVVGEAYGVRPIDWLGIVDLAGACLSAVRLVERRSGR